MNGLGLNKNKLKMLIKGYSVVVEIISIEALFFKNNGISFYINGIGLISVFLLPLNCQLFMAQ